MDTPLRQIRAVYTDTTIRVYQAYSKAIADPAVAAGGFVSPPFKMERMTWIKPSFLWMMYRCGWGKKKGQERILAIDITREGFHWALANSSLSHYKPAIHGSEEEWQRQKNQSPVRIQWDPERGIHLERLEYRSIQIGLSGEAVHKYVNEWIVELNDITDYVASFADSDDPVSLLPEERPYKIPEELRNRLGMK